MATKMLKHVAKSWNKNGTEYCAFVGLIVPNVGVEKHYCLKRTAISFLKFSSPDFVF
jgi:hypothetical protein